MKIEAKEITGSWPQRARKVRDYPERSIAVIDGDLLKQALTEGLTPEQAIWAAISARIFVRYTDSTTRVVVLWKGRAFTGEASGYGYDRETAALAGMPVGMVGSEVVVLTDHCGLDRYKGEERPSFAGDKDREFIAGRSGCLPAPLFTLEV